MANDIRTIFNNSNKNEPADFAFVTYFKTLIIL